MDKKESATLTTFCICGLVVIFSGFFFAQSHLADNIQSDKKQQEQSWYYVIVSGDDWRTVRYSLHYYFDTESYAYMNSYGDIVYPDIYIDGHGSYTYYVNEENINGTWVET